MKHISLFFIAELISEFSKNLILVSNSKNESSSFEGKDSLRILIISFISSKFSEINSFFV